MLKYKYMYPNNQQYPQNNTPQQPGPQPPYPPQPNQQPYSSPQQAYPQYPAPQQQASSSSPYPATQDPQQIYSQTLTGTNGQPQYSIDYLNQIAAKPQNQPIDMKAKILLWGLIGLVVVIAIAVFGSLMSSSSSSTVQVGGLATELAVAKKVADDAHKNIKNPKLRAANGQFSTTLTGSNQKLSPYLIASGYKEGAIDSSTVEAAMDPELTDILEQARLNGIFDRTYTNEIIHKIGLIEISIQQLSKTSDESTNQELQKITSDLEVMKKQFTEISTSGL